MCKKILILGNSPSGLYDFRGALIKELVSQGNEVAALTPKGLKFDEISTLGAKVIETPIDRRGVNPTKDIKLERLYHKLFKLEKPDLIITYTIKPNVYGGYAAEKLKIPYVANVTGLGTTFQQEGVLKRLVTRMYRIGLKNAKTVFFENVENRDVFVENHICEKSQTCVLHGAGVDLEKFYLANYPDGDTIRFLFIGRVMKEKGVIELFSAMKRLRVEGVQCSLDILGYYEDDFKDRIDTYKKAGWLRFHGYQPDVRQFIEQSHCFVLPSWHEGMANTNLECAAMGRPVITTNIHGCLEAVEDGVSGYLCEKQNSDDLYQKMVQFISLSFEDRKAMGLAGRKRMEEIFDKRKVVEETIGRLF